MPTNLCKNCRSYLLGPNCSGVRSFSLCIMISFFKELLRFLVETNMIYCNYLKKKWDIRIILGLIHPGKKLFNVCDEIRPKHFQENSLN